MIIHFPPEADSGSPREELNHLRRDLISLVAATCSQFFVAPLHSRISQRSTKRKKRNVSL